MPRHDRSHGVYWAPGNKGGSRRRKASTGLVASSGGRRAGHVSKYRRKRSSRATG